LPRHAVKVILQPLGFVPLALLSLRDSSTIHCSLATRHSPLATVFTHPPVRLNGNCSSDQMATHAAGGSLQAYSPIDKVQAWGDIMRSFGFLRSLGTRRSFKIISAALILSLPLVATAQQPLSPSEAIDKIVSQEQAEVGLLRQYSPLVETYIQYLRPDKRL